MKRILIITALVFTIGCAKTASVHVATSQERQELRVSRAERRVEWAQHDLVRAETKLAKAEADLTLANAGLDADADTEPNG